MQFIIHAYDGTDEFAPERRAAARPEHLENIEKIKKYEIGSVICAGGIIENGRAVGSFLIMEFPTVEAFDEYLENEPYMVHGVWENVKVEKCNVVIVNDEKVGK